MNFANNARMGSVIQDKGINATKKQSHTPREKLPAQEVTGCLMMLAVRRSIDVVGYDDALTAG